MFYFHTCDGPYRTWLEVFPPNKYEKGAAHSVYSGILVPGETSWDMWNVVKTGEIYNRCCNKEMGRDESSSIEHVWYGILTGAIWMGTNTSDRTAHFNGMFYFSKGESSNGNGFSNFNQI